MNAREAMEALLEGKTLCTENYKYKLNDEGNVVESFTMKDDWHNICTFINNSKLKEEYTLTFKEAVMAMLDGKIVVSEYYSGLRNKFEDGQFLHSIKYEYDWDITHGFENGEIEGKWKVVEE